MCAKLRVNKAIGENMKFRRGSSLVFAAVMIAASAGLVSLGGSAANAGAASAKKSPYIVGTMYPLTGAGLNEPVWLAGAVAAAAGVNRRGGFNGHPIKPDIKLTDRLHPGRSRT